MQQPKLRFKTDDGDDFPNLEVKRLGDITIPYNVRNKNTLPLEIYSVNNIVGFVPQSEQFDDAGYLRNTDTSIYMIVPPKHFAYNPARIDIGSIGYQYLDHDVQVSSLYEVFKTSDSVDDDFLWMWFHTSYFNHTVKRLQEGGVRLYFYYDKMQETKIGLPSLAEQQKIALLFSELDTLIQSTEKELEGYRELKQCMLQKMFPKKGETVPEIRFPEFTGDWGQCKLGDVCKTYSGGTPKSGKSSYYDNGTIPFIRSGEIHNDRTELYITEKGMNESSAKMVDVGDILYALYGATSGEVDISKINGAINQAILCIKPITGFDRKFIVETLRHNKESILRTYLQGGQGNLSAQIIQSQIFNFPCLAEQQRISEYFSNLDNLITSQQQELDGYKELKKGLLQQMFC